MPDDDTRCTRTRSDGEPCEAPAIGICECDGHRCCWFHCETTDVVERREASRRTAGRRNRERALDRVTFVTWPEAPGRRRIRMDLYRRIAEHLNALNARSNHSPAATAELVATYDILRRLGLDHREIEELSDEVAF